MKGVVVIKLLPTEYGNISKYIITLVKTYVIFGCVLGLSFGTIRAVQYNNISHIIEDLIYKGFLPAIIFIIFVGLLDLIQKAKCYLKYQAVAFDVRQVREFLINDSHQAVYDKIKELLINLPKIDIIFTDINNGIIKGLVKRSWKSLGEKLTVDIKSISNHETKVTLSSEPKFKIALIDYCKNFENVEMILNLVEQEMKRKSGFF